MGASVRWDTEECALFLGKRTDGAADKVAEGAGRWAGSAAYVMAASRLPEEAGVTLRAQTRKVLLLRWIEPTVNTGTLG
jgi:hypothetical protein